MGAAVSSTIMQLRSWCLAVVMVLGSCGKVSTTGDAGAGDGAVSPDAPEGTLLVVSTLPTDSALGVAKDATITITFSAPVDSASIADSVVVTDPNGSVVGTITAAGDTLLFTPQKNWHLLGEYSVVVSGVTAQQGAEAMANDHSFSFQVVDGLWKTEVLIGESSEYAEMAGNMRGDVLRGYTTRDAVGNARATHFDSESGVFTDTALEGNSTNHIQATTVVNSSGDGIVAWQSGLGSHWNRLRNGVWQGEKLDSSFQTLRVHGLLTDGTAISLQPNVGGLMFRTLGPNAPNWSTSALAVANATPRVSWSVGDTFFVLVTVGNQHFSSSYSVAGGWTAAIPASPTGIEVNFWSKSRVQGSDDLVFSWWNPSNDEIWYTHYDAVAMNWDSAQFGDGQYGNSLCFNPSGARIGAIHRDGNLYGISWDGTAFVESAVLGTGDNFTVSCAVDMWGNGHAFWEGSTGLQWSRYVKGQGWASALPIGTAGPGVADLGGNVTLVYPKEDSGVHSRRFE